jgi:two-component system, NarL family, sensor histidine kinase UhpB
MWLALRLIVRLVGVVALCLAFAVAWAMVDTHRSIDRETSASADRVAAQLEILYWRELMWRGGLRSEGLLPTPEWQTLATLKLVSAGVCVAFAPGTGEPTRLCGQVEGVGAQAPVWFESIYEGILGPQAGLNRALSARQADAGSIFAVADPEAAVRQAWLRVSTIADFAAAMALAIFVFATLAIAYTLAPTAAIVGGLRQMALGDYRRRLPPFRAREFALIGRAVNDLAGRLERARAERIALTRRLIEVRDDERKQMARELHDEFGQCLTATLALAGAMEAGARGRPDLVQDARAIGGVARRMMTSLRGALAQLRNPIAEELGLEASLAQLVAGWNALDAPRTAVRLDFAADLGGVPDDIASNVYRIAQECLTNAIRHGAPTEVRVRVGRIAERAGAISLTVEDDGGGDAARVVAAAGRGIAGMRERVEAFGGDFMICRAVRGVCVAATIPLAAA